MGNQRPSIGRIVIYHHPGSADGRFPPKVSPAIVQAVNPDGSVELFVMSVYGGLFFNHNVHEGEGPSCWSWPERVPAEGSSPQVEPLERTSPPAIVPSSSSA